MQPVFKKPTHQNSKSARKGGKYIKGISLLYQVYYYCHPCAFVFQNKNQ